MYAGAAVAGSGTLTAGTGAALAGEITIISQILKALKSKSLKDKSAKKLLDLYNEIETDKKSKTGDSKK
jgi:hypothetical protein